MLEHVVLKSNPVYRRQRQVEVLRGPQGTLFGRNTTAGIIKFDTNRPTNDFTRPRLRVVRQLQHRQTIDAGVGGPIVKDVLSVPRFGAVSAPRQLGRQHLYRRRATDGTVGGKDKLGGFDEKDVRVQLMLTPPDTGFTGLAFRACA